MATIVNIPRDRRFEGIGQGVADFLKARREKRKQDALRQGFEAWQQDLARAQNAEEVANAPSLLTRLPPDAQPESLDEWLRLAQTDSVLRERAQERFNFDEEQFINPQTRETVTLPRGETPTDPNMVKLEDFTTQEDIESTDLEQERTRAATQQARAGTEGARARTEATRLETQQGRQNLETFGSLTPDAEKKEARDFLTSVVGLPPNKVTRSEINYTREYRAVRDSVGGSVGLFGSGGDDANTAAIKAEMDRQFRSEIAKPKGERRSPSELHDEAAAAIQRRLDEAAGGGLGDVGDEGGEGDNEGQEEGSVFEGLGALFQGSRTRPSTGAAEEARRSSKGRVTIPSNRSRDQAAPDTSRKGAKVGEPEVNVTELRPSEQASLRRKLKEIQNGDSSLTVGDLAQAMIDNGMTPENATSILEKEINAIQRGKK